MQGSIVIVGLICGFACATVLAAPLDERDEVQQGMKRAFQDGLSRFGSSIENRELRAPMPDQKSARVFSLYSKGLNALGGGKPSTRDQYRRHSYFPLAPTIVPEEHEVITGKMTPKQAADRYRPHRPMQHAEENHGI